jgi:hypothetical protein
MGWFDAVAEEANHFAFVASKRLGSSSVHFLLGDSPTRISPRLCGVAYSESQGVIFYDRIDDVIRVIPVYHISSIRVGDLEYHVLQHQPSQ